MMKRWLAILLVCVFCFSLVVPTGLAAEGETPEATPVVETATEAPSEAPTAEPTEEPAAEPTEEPTAEPTAEPTEEAEAMPEATVEPTPEATLEPTPEPTVDPLKPFGDVLSADYEALAQAVTDGDLAVTLDDQWAYFLYTAPATGAVHFEVVGKDDAPVEEETEAYLYDDPTQPHIAYAAGTDETPAFAFDAALEEGKTYALALRLIPDVVAEGEEAPAKEPVELVLHIAPAVAEVEETPTPEPTLEPVLTDYEALKASLIAAIAASPMDMPVDMDNKAIIAGQLDTYNAMREDKDYLADEVLVLLDSEEQAQWLATLFGGEVVSFSSFGFAVLRMSGDIDMLTAVTLASDPEIAVPAFEPNMLMKPLGAVIPNDPYYSSQYFHVSMDNPFAWEITLGTGVVVAIIDTGLAAGHPDFDYATRVHSASGMVRGGVYTAGAYQDHQGHGTHVAGIIGATQNNAIGVTGVAPETVLLILKANKADAGSDAQIFSDADVIEACNKAASNGAQIINLSMGAKNMATSLAWDACMNSLRDSGILVVCAAGDTGSPSLMYPAAYNATHNNVIAVSSTRSGNALASGTNTGADICAPGDSIYSTTITSYGRMSGTSMAAANVSGAAALVKAAKGISAGKIKSLLKSSAKKIGNGNPALYGAGLVNTARALGTQTLTVVANNSAYGKVTGGGNYDYGSDKLLVATANEGYRFVEWKCSDPSVVLPPAPHTPEWLFTVYAPCTVTAVFESLGTPKVTVTLQTQNSTQVAWKGILNANAYEVWVFPSSNPLIPDYERVATVTAMPGQTVLTPYTFTHTGLEEEQTYSYKVRAVVLDNPLVPTSDMIYRSKFSAVVSVKAQWVKPTLTVTQASYMRMRLSWKPVPGAVGYTIERGSQAQEGSMVIIDEYDGPFTTDPITFDDTTVVPGTKYYYRITPRDGPAGAIATDYGKASSFQSGITAWSTITLTAGVYDYQSVILAWNMPKDVAGVRIYRSFSNTFNLNPLAGPVAIPIVDLSGGEGGYIDVSNTLTGRTVYYMAVAYGYVGPTNIIESTKKSSVISVKPVWAKPSVKVSTLRFNEAILTFTAVPGADSYNVYWTKGKESNPEALLGSIVDNGSASYVFSTLTNGGVHLSPSTKYFFRVEPEVSGVPYAAASGYIATSTPSLAVPAVSVSVGGPESLVLKWKAIAGCDGYEIEWSPSGKSGTFVPLATEPAASITYTDPTTAKRYYRMRTVGTGTSGPIYSTWSGTVSATPSWGTVSLSVKQLSYKTVGLYWTNINDTDGYEIYWGLTTKTMTNVITVAGAAPTSATPYIHTITPGTTIYYKVRAYITGAPTRYGAFSATKSIKPAWGATKLASLATSPTDIALSWPLQAGATKYDIEVSQVSSSRGFVHRDTVSVNAVSPNPYLYTLTGLMSGTTYYIRVIPYDAANLSSAPTGTKGAYSNVITAKASFPTVTWATVPIVNVDHTTVRLQWKPVQFSTGYIVERAVSSSGPWLVVNPANVVGTTCDDDGSPALIALVTGTKYYYRVRATNGTTNGSVSIVKSFAPMPEAPAMTFDQQVEGTELSWTHTPGITGYEIWYVKGSSTTYTKLKTVVADPSDTTITYMHYGVLGNSKIKYRLRAYCVVNGKTFYSTYMQATP